MAAPFLIVAIGAGADGGARELAHATVAFFAAGTVANLVWGQLADRAGFRAVFLVGAAIWLGALGWALATPPTPASAVPLFLLVGAGQSGIQMASVNLVYEFAERGELGVRIAVVNAIGELFGAIAPLAGGAIADDWSYRCTVRGSRHVHAAGARHHAARRSPATRSDPMIELERIPWTETHAPRRSRAPPTPDRRRLRRRWRGATRRAARTRRTAHDHDEMPLVRPRLDHLSTSTARDYRARAGRSASCCRAGTLHAADGRTRRRDLSDRREELASHLRTRSPDAEALVERVLLVEAHERIELGKRDQAVAHGASVAVGT